MIQTELRPYRLADAEQIMRFAGDFRVSKYTLNIPHPYTEGMAEAWMALNEAFA